MTDRPNPWNFRNIHKGLLSPDGQHQLVYYDLNEIAMGAPIGGTCFLEGNGLKIQIHDWCGGPAVWQKEGQSFAIPIWTRTLLEGTIQKFGIVDLQNLELRIFEKSFRVLDLRSFEGNRVIAILDNEAHSFDIDTEKIETVIKLNG